MAVKKKPARSEEPDEVEAYDQQKEQEQPQQQIVEASDDLRAEEWTTEEETSPEVGSGWVVSPPARDVPTDVVDGGWSSEGPTSWGSSSTGMAIRSNRGRESDESSVSNHVIDSAGWPQS